MPFLLALLLCFHCADAAVYKCVDADGKTRYQAAACDGTVVPIDETPPPPPEARPPAPPVFSEDLAGRPRRPRSEAAKNRFKALQPCPSTGASQGPCPGYVIDHIKPLACGGADEPGNMQWQDIEAAKAKDRWERAGCQRAGSLRHAPYSQAAGRRVYIGPRGGRYTYSRNGNKRYLGGR